MKYYKAEDVIKCVAQYIMTDAKRDNFYVCGDIEDYIEFTEAILADLPTIEVSEDCISKEYLKSFEYINKGDFNSVETIREWIDNAPSVVPTTEQSSKVGEWKPFDRTWGREIWACSVCEESVANMPTNADKPLYDYCPNCGAKMKG